MRCTYFFSSSLVHFLFPRVLAAIDYFIAKIMMLLRKLNCLQTGVLLLFTATTLYSCSNARNGAPGGIEMPERTMLPDNHVPNIGEGTEEGSLELIPPALPFATQYGSLPVSGSRQPFVFISLPDSASDAKVAALINRYHFLANSLVDQWAGQKTGILLDLRSTGEHVRNASFLTRNTHATFPVVLLWDEAAATRVTGYFRIMETVPGMQPATSSLVNDSTLSLLPFVSTPVRQQLTAAPVGSCFR